MNKREKFKKPKKPKQQQKKKQKKKKKRKRKGKKERKKEKSKQLRSGRYIITYICDYVRYDGCLIIVKSNQRKESS